VKFNKIQTDYKYYHKDAVDNIMLTSVYFVLTLTFAPVLSWSKSVNVGHVQGPGPTVNVGHVEHATINFSATLVNYFNRPTFQ